MSGQGRGAGLSEKVIYPYRFQGIILMSDDKGMREEVDEELTAGIFLNENYPAWEDIHAYWD